jgi:hypothetical protein
LEDVKVELRPCLRPTRESSAMAASVGKDFPAGDISFRRLAPGRNALTLRHPKGALATLRSGRDGNRERRSLETLGENCFAQRWVRKILAFRLPKLIAG